MDEEEKKQDTTENTGDGNKPETTPIIDEANKAAERMEAATKELKTQNDRQEQFLAKKALGGSAEAGKPSEKKEEKLSDEKYAEAMERGEVDPFKEDGYV